MDRTAAAAGHSIDRSSAAFLGARPILVGRAREQAILREELATTISGHGRLVLLGGEAGIGKTTLARDLIQQGAAQGCVVLVGSCYDLSNTPPYGPWLELFEASRRDPAVPSPPAAFADGQLATVTDQAALFAEVRRFFSALTTDRPALVLLEDVHWADPASVDLLRHVGPHVRHWPVLLLATYRGHELTPGHPFAQVLPALVREGDGRRLDLRRLDTVALRSLVTSQFDLVTTDEDRLVAYLERHAEGNPFFATELLRTLEDGALLRRSEDGWTLGELDRVFVPSLLRQVIDGRVARLGEATRKALALAAVIGQEVPLALWAEVAELDEEAVLAVVERAVEAHLLEAEQDGTRVRFVHALTREALYEGVLPPRRRLWHRRVAEALMASAQADPDAVAFHLQEAGDPRAWEWLVKAGDRAQLAYAWLTAAARLRAAADLLTGVDDKAGMRSRLFFRLARLYRFSYPTEAVEILDEVERLAARRGDAILAAEVLYQRGGALCYANQFRSGLAEMERGMEALEAMPLEEAPSVATVGDWLADVLPETAPIDTTGEETAAALLHAAGFHFRRSTHPLFLAYAGQPQEACAIGERYIAVLAGAPTAKGGIYSSTSFTYYGLGIAYAALGRPDDAHRAWTRARELLREFEHHVVVAFTLLDELRDSAFTYEAAEPARRRGLAAEAEAALGRAGGALHPGVSPRLAWLGCLALDGQWAAALQILGNLPTPGNTYLRREVTDTQAVLARHRGEPETAWAQIRPLFPEGSDTAPGDIIHQEGLFLQRLAADLCLDAGDLKGARDWLEAHDHWLAWSGSILGRADGRVAWARYHRATGESDRARAAATEALALAESPSQPLVCLAAHRFLGEIETAVGQFGVADAHLLTALEWADACDAPFERALTLLALVELHLVTRMADEAAALLEEVRRICTPLGAQPALARADALAAHLATMRSDKTSSAGLTERELDVLRLLAEDLTLEQIATRLFISYSTVKTHLDHIRDKFGVNQRRDVVARAVQLGLLAPSPHHPSPRRVGDG